MLGIGCQRLLPLHPVWRHLLRRVSIPERSHGNSIWGRRIHRLPHQSPMLARAMDGNRRHGPFCRSSANDDIQILQTHSAIPESMSYMACPCCGRLYGPGSMWFVCDTCGFKVCIFCCDKHKGFYSNGGFKCSQCSSGQMHQKRM